MKVKIKEFNVDMDVKSKGIEFEVRESDDSAQLGDCYITMTGLIWCLGKKGKAKGIKIEWREFIEIMKSSKSKSEAVKAAKQIVD